MSEPPEASSSGGTTAPPAPPPVEPPPEPPPIELPAWVPTLVAALLVAIAALAVYTGMRDRSRSVSSVAPPRAATASPVRETLAESGVPGEPQPGASRQVHGELGENVPAAVSEPPHGVAPAGVAVVRRGMQLIVEPPDAAVFVNELPIGSAAQFRGRQDAYEFAEPGTYTIRLAAPNREDVSYVITVDANADDELAVIVSALRRKG